MKADPGIVLPLPFRSPLVATKVSSYYPEGKIQYLLHYDKAQQKCGPAKEYDSNNNEGTKTNHKRM